MGEGALNRKQERMWRASRKLLRQKSDAPSDRKPRTELWSLASLTAATAGVGGVLIFTYLHDLGLSSLLLEVLTGSVASFVFFSAAAYLLLQLLLGATAVGCVCISMAPFVVCSRQSARIAALIVSTSWLLLLLYTCLNSLNGTSESVIQGSIVGPFVGIATLCYMRSVFERKNLFKGDTSIFGWRSVISLLWAAAGGFTWWQFVGISLPVLIAPWPNSSASLSFLRLLQVGILWTAACGTFLYLALLSWNNIASAATAERIHNLQTKRFVGVALTFVFIQLWFGHRPLAHAGAHLVGLSDFTTRTYLVSSKDTTMSDAVKKKVIGCTPLRTSNVLVVCDTGAQIFLKSFRSKSPDLYIPHPVCAIETPSIVSVMLTYGNALWYLQPNCTTMIGGHSIVIQSIPLHSDPTLGQQQHLEPKDTGSNLETP